jgi:hypothetical protein
MLDREHLDPLPGMITSAEDIALRLAGLDAITSFQLTEEAWQAAR